MDPVILAILNKPVCYFLGRADVFTKITKPIFKNLHMLPIYRQQDGVNTKEKNSEIFNACSQILIKKKNILIFGEGFTDDVFIRRLKPLKKGAVRIGFIALEQNNWKAPIYIAAIGCNYANPNIFDSELVICNSKPICLNNFKDQYKNNPLITINKVNKQVEDLLKKQITYIENKDDSLLHENIMRITGRGINVKYQNHQFNLEQRYKMSQQTADKLNRLDEQVKAVLNSKLENYFKSLDVNKIEDICINELNSKNKYLLKNTLLLILFFPIAVLGFFHAYLPYLPLKVWIEKKFKRPVFWSSVKMMLGALIITLINIPIIVLLDKFLINNMWISIVYFLSIGIFGSISYYWIKQIKIIFRIIDLKQNKTKELIKIREEIKNDLSKHELIA